MQEYGICRLSIVPLRAYGKEQAEMCSQLLFGEYYTVLQRSENGNWLKIQCQPDNYIGWIDHLHHTPISEEHWSSLAMSSYGILTAPGQLKFKQFMLNLLQGSLLPYRPDDLFPEAIPQQLTIASGAQQGDFMKLKAICESFLGAPYLWGGKTMYGIDCSGLVQIAFRCCGYFLPRDASQQITVGTEVASLEQVVPGDLCFFKKDNKINHVGILLNNSDIIHASGYVKVGKIDSAGIIDQERLKLTHHLCGIRRVLRHNLE